MTEVLIAGGAVLGAAVAFWLTRLDPGIRVTVVEPDPGYATASTALSAAGIRSQFTNEINVAISRFGIEFIRDFARWTGPAGGVPDLGLRENGYLFLAETETGALQLENLAAMQRGLGAATEVLSPADYVNHIDKWDFTVPFVCGATNLGEALRRITEGAAMIRSKGEAGTGDVSEAMKHIRRIRGEIAALGALSKDELYVAAKELQAPYDLVAEIAETGTLPVVLFVAGGVATPADAAMMMQLGADGVFVGSGIFKSGNPAARAAAIVKATTFFDDAKVIADVSRGLGEAMVGINVTDLPAPHRLAERGW